MKNEKELIEKLKNGYSEWSELIEDCFSKEEIDLIISALEKQMNKEEMPVMPEKDERSMIASIFIKPNCIKVHGGINEAFAKAMEELRKRYVLFALGYDDRTFRIELHYIKPKQ